LFCHASIEIIFEVQDPQVQAFFAKALVNVLNPSMIGSTTTTTCNASSSSITWVIEKCDVLGKDHLPFFMDLGPSC
jgi:hypothetical protein